MASKGRDVLGSNRQYMRWASSFSLASDLHCQGWCMPHLAACTGLKDLPPRGRASLARMGEFTPGGHKI